VTGSLSAPDPARIINAMTVDVEDYFHVSAFDGIVPRASWATLESRVERNTERLLTILDQAGVTATFFVLGWVAERFPALVRRIAEQRHEVASHGYAHRLVYDLTPGMFREDIRRSKDVLETAAGAAVEGYRAPSYSVTPRSLWALDVLIEEGFRYDASIFPIHHDRYGIPLSPRHPYYLNRPGGSIVEAPASTVRWGLLNFPVAGGGYFRILPYQWTRWGIARINRLECRPAIFYMHPWEIDPDQPRLTGSLLSRFRHYRNLHTTESRLRRLLSDFNFASMAVMLRSFAANTAAVPYTSAPLPYLW
jgi:polysaccharide deacetylase family protein (PEP-CTERM system associated)